MPTKGIVLQQGSVLLVNSLNANQKGDEGRGQSKSK